MSNELLTFLVDSTVVLSLALLAVLLLRQAWLRFFGASNALLLWLVVPLALGALLLPAPVQQIEVARSAVSPSQAGPVAATPDSVNGRSAAPLLPAVRERIVGALPVPASAKDPVAASGIPVLLLALWLGGVALMVLVMALRQRRLLRSLGPLTRRPDGSFTSVVRETGPALIGGLRPRIVLPEDFERRYSPEQQELIVAHERSHLRRGDAQFTLLACMLRCVYWFNPLVHLAWPMFRIDQELACDAAVLRRHPERRRAYAEAMLATRVEAPRLPVGCSWLTGHPLKKRIRVICSNPVGSIRLAAGAVLVILAGSVAAIGTWTHQEPQRFYQAVLAPSLGFDVSLAEPMARTPGRDRFVSMSRVALPVPAVAIEPPRSESATGSNALPQQLPAAARAEHGVAEADSTPQAPSTPGPGASEHELVDVEHARLVEVNRPEFPETRFNPRLVSYPGMPDAELPGADWSPRGQVWVLLLRATLDETGTPIDVTIEDTNLDPGRSAERFRALAMDAVRSWRFAPARIGGEPVRSAVQLPFYFDTGEAPVRGPSLASGPTGFNPFSYQAVQRATNR